MDFSIFASLVKITYHIMVWFECLLVIPFTYNYRLLDKAGKCIYYYLLISAAGAVTANVISRLWQNNMWVIATMTMAQFLPLSIFYYRVIKSRLLKRLIKIFFPVVTALFFLDVFWWHGLFVHQPIFITSRNSLLLIYGGSFVIQQLLDRELINKTVFINTIPNFWFNAGLFVFNSTYFLFGLSFSLYHQAIRYFEQVMQLVFTAGIIQFIFFLIGLLKTIKLSPKLF